MPRPQIDVSPVQKESSPRLVNASILARKELSSPTVPVSIVIPIAKPAKEPRTTNVYHVPKSFLFSSLDVAYRLVFNPNTSTRLIRHARIATQVARVAPVLGLLNVYHVRFLPIL